MVIQVPLMQKKKKKLEFYSQVQPKIDIMSKQDVLLVVADWNAKAGNSKEENVVGLHGLGKRNEAELLTHFCQSNNFFIADTFFKQPQ